MPPAQPLPEVAGVNGVSPNTDDNEDDDKDRQRHIEVCARIRPLTIQKESSNSFFEKQQSQSAGTSKSNLRRPGIPRPSSLRTPPRPKAAPTPEVISAPPPSQSVYAWDCFGGDTVSQSTDSTELVKGRTHAYTLDRVYGPDQSTQQLYDNSIKSLVHAAMDGYHSSILAYGQTSTGKTHTMTGTSNQPGIIPLSVRECFDYLERQDQPREYLLRVSYLEGKLR
jgi:hypothetical protein